MSGTITREYIDQLWQKFEDYKATAEQHEFVKLLMYDSQLIPRYKDLQTNWDTGHAEIFARVMLQQVFPAFGIDEF